MIDNSGMFVPHPNLSDQINRNIIRSEIEGGVYLRDLPDQSELEVWTQNRGYRLTVLADGHALISGHPEFCPGAGAGADHRIELGRLDAQGGVSRPRNAPRIPASGLSRPDCHVHDRGYPSEGRIG